MKYWEMGEDIALADGVLEEEKVTMFANIDSG